MGLKNRAKVSPRGGEARRIQVSVASTPPWKPQLKVRFISQVINI